MAEVTNVEVALNPRIFKKPQNVKCPFCGRTTRMQFLRGEGVMSGWDEECEHYYAAGNDSHVSPTVIFRKGGQENG